MAYPTTSNNLTTAHSSGQIITSADINAIAVDADQLTLKVGTGASTAAQGAYLTGTAAGATQWHPSPIINVMDYGLVGNGSTNDTSALNTLLTAIGTTPATLVFPQGHTFVISAITLVTNASLTFLGWGATLLHAASASNPLFSGTPAQLNVYGLTFDGNSPNQTNTALTVVDIFLNQGCLFQGCRFTRSLHHALVIESSVHAAIVRDCQFDNSAQWSGVIGQDNTYLRFQSNSGVPIYHGIVEGCDFSAPIPATAGYGPGGVIVDAQVEFGFQPIRATIRNCRFLNIGQNPGPSSGTFVACVYIYNTTDGSIVDGCKFENPYFTCVAVEDTSNFVVSNNYVNCNSNNSGHVFAVQGNERANNVQTARFIFANNIIEGGGTGAEAFYVDAGSGSTPSNSFWAKDIIISGNHVTNCRMGVSLRQCTGHQQIINNTFADLSDASYGWALRIGEGTLANPFDSMSGRLVFQGNTCRNLAGNAVSFNPTQTYTGLDVEVLDNRFENTRDADAGLQLRNCDRAIVRGNVWKGTPLASTFGAILTFNTVGYVIVSDNTSDTDATISKTSVTTYREWGNRWNYDNSTTLFPGTIADGGTFSRTVTALVCAVGDIATAGYNGTGMAQGVHIDAAVVGAATISVTIFNNSGGSITFGSGNASVAVQRLA